MLLHGLPTKCFRTVRGLEIWSERWRVLRKIWVHLRLFRGAINVIFVFFVRRRAALPQIIHWSEVIKVRYWTSPGVLTMIMLLLAVLKIVLLKCGISPMVEYQGKRNPDFHILHCIRRHFTHYKKLD